MRVRITLRVRDRLAEMAKEESERTGSAVTVSDLVRAACYNYLLVQQSLRHLENAPPEHLDDDDEESEVEDEAALVRVYVNPMLAS